MREEILTLKDTVKSDYGKDLYYFYEFCNAGLPYYGGFSWENVVLVKTASTFKIRPDLEEKVNDRIIKLAANSKFKDNKKLRFEGIGISHFDSTLYIYVSDEISYLQHNVMRDIPGLDILDYPTPLTVNGLQETLDGYLLFGERNTAVSDQSGAAIVSAGFHEFSQKNNITLYLGDIFNTVIKEAYEETEYWEKTDSGEIEKNPIVKSSMKLITIVRGSNTDVAAGFYVPLNVDSGHVELNRNNKEFNNMIKIPNSDYNLELMIETGNLKGVKLGDGKDIKADILLADHPIGVLEAYRNMRSLGLITPNFIND